MSVIRTCLLSYGSKKSRKSKKIFLLCVNALSRAYSISTMTRAFDAFRRGVSMPCLGLTSFLPVSFAAMKAFDACVNALSRAHVISTTWKQGFVSVSQCVSMPCLGLTSFLRSGSPIRNNVLLIRVNALSRAHVISTVLNSSIDDIVCGVSMPCLGLTSFLQIKTIRDELIKAMCQCPVSGSRHFY